MDKPVAATVEYAARRERERQKAVAKYGPDALTPAGHPELDVMDYLINELVGLNRYSEILEERCKLIEALIRRRDVREACREGRAIAHQLLASSGRQALDLIAVWQALRAAGLHLGRREGQ